MVKRTLTHEEREVIRKKNEEFLKYCIRCEGKLMNGNKKTQNPEK